MVLSRYSAMVLGSILPPGPVGGGAVIRRVRVTCLMRSISSWAVSLSATFWPISLEPVQRDMGEVRAGVRLRQTFTLINDGPATVAGIEARPGCGCMGARVEPARLGPGERATLTLDVNTLGQAAGERVWRATLHF